MCDVCDAVANIASNFNTNEVKSLHCVLRGWEEGEWGKEEGWVAHEPDALSHRTQ